MDQSASWTFGLSSEHMPEYERKKILPGEFFFFFQQSFCAFIPPTYTVRVVPDFLYQQL